MDPEIVVRREHRQAEDDERAPADEERASAAPVDGAEELGLIEFARSHRARISGSGGAGDCVYELAPVTFAIDETGGQLQIMGGDPPTYIMMGGAVVGMQLLDFAMTCPGGEATVQSDAKPWIEMSDFRELPDPGNVMEGTESFDYGATYTWHFTRN